MGIDEKNGMTNWRIKGSSISVLKFVLIFCLNSKIELLLQNAPEKSVVVLHGVAHNPTGVDPTQEQWIEIVKICQVKLIFP